MGEMVSCLTASRPQRWGQLQRSILDFLAQRYAARELVVVVDGGNDFASAVQAFVDQQMLPEDGPAVHVLARPAKSPLECLTFAAVHASGRILCLWDDDNLNHPLRLTEQVAVQQRFKTAVTVLTEGLYYFPKDAQLFVVNVERPQGSAGQRTLPSTLMAYRECFPVLEPQARTKPSEALLNATAKAGRKIVPIAGKPFLHLVGVTHDNLRGYDYHRRVAQEQARPAAWLQARADVLQDALDTFSWDGLTVAVDGSDAGGFEYETKKKWPVHLYPVKVDADPAPDPKPPATPKEPAGLPRP